MYTTAIISALYYQTFTLVGVWFEQNSSINDNNYCCMHVIVNNNLYNSTYSYRAGDLAIVQVQTSENLISCCNTQEILIIEKCCISHFSLAFLMLYSGSWLMINFMLS